MYTAFKTPQRSQCEKILVTPQKSTFTNMEFTKEVELAPGIYLSKPIKRSNESNNTAESQDAKNKLLAEDHPEVLYIRGMELKVSINALLKSNQYMRENYPEDPICIEVFIIQLMHSVLLWKDCQDTHSAIVKVCDWKCDGD